MADQVDDPMAAALAAAQAKALAGLGGAKVVPMRAGSLPEGGQGPAVVPLSKFLADTETPNWVIDGIVQRGHLISLTAPTNHGKTAVSMVMAVAVAAGKPFAERATVRGRVLILCGENQDGFRIRLEATMSAAGVSGADLDGWMFVVPFAAGIDALLPKIRDEAARIGELAFVLVDTSVSYFSGADENDNVAAYEHAAMLRMMTTLPGHPCVMANCHPTAASNRERCVPRGGSAFLNEVDDNYMVWADGDTSELAWNTKKRGPDFDPLFFEYRVTTVERFGTKVPTVVAHHIDEERENHIRKQRREYENRLLYAMLAEPHGTIRSWAEACGFKAATDGKPLTSKVARLLDRLKEVQLVAHNRRDGWHLTKKGTEEAKSID